MKILFFGRGVIGTQYAWALEHAGHTVEFYVREGRKKQYGSYINLEMMDTRQPRKDRMIKEKWSVTMQEEIKKDHDYDLIFVSVNAEQITDAVTYLTPRTGNATVLFIGNFWNDIQESAHPLPAGQVVWGFPGAGGGYEENTLYGGLYRAVHFGISESGPSRKDSELHRLFTEAGFKVRVHKSFQNWLRNHFISNLAIEMEVIRYGSFKNVVSSRQALTGMNLNMKELIPLLKAKGAHPAPSTKVIGFLPAGLIGFLMHNIIFSPRGMPYSLVEHNDYKPGPSVQHIISEARTYNIETPRLYALENLLQKADIQLSYLL